MILPFFVTSNKDLAGWLLLFLGFIAVSVPARAEESAFLEEGLAPRPDSMPTASEQRTLPASTRLDKTWFGMGYERRMRLLGRGAASPRRERSDGRRRR